jgi:predicted hotdog family 3-hydroxylacyl-ACP dehydratase
MIPHRGAMCLLDGVQRWNETGIVCISETHHRVDNPLREDDRLRTVALVEYAAQAAAIHARLIGAGIGGKKTAYIGAVKGLKLHAQYVEPSLETLTYSAECVLQNNGGAIYQVAVESGKQLLIEARVVLVLPPDQNSV